MTPATAKRLARISAGEIERAKASIRVDGFPRPYFISHLIRDERRFRVRAQYGGLKVVADSRERNAFADVRVGSYAYDQVRDGGLLDNDKDAESYGYVDLPFGDEPDALRHGLWRLTDGRYREAVEAWMDKRSRELTYRDPARGFRAFQRMQPRVELSPRAFPEIDCEGWAGFVQRVSRMLKRYPDVKESHVEFEADHVLRVYVSSEGVRRAFAQPIWSLECWLWHLSPKGDATPWTIKHTVCDPAELPDEAAFRAEIRRAIALVRQLAAAPSVRSFCGPALLEPVPAGLLVHEAVGHRLEGNRLLSTGEGQTFKGALGRQVLPPFLSVRDDPQLERFDGRSLVGHYPFDDEGVDAAEATLVRDGRLESYLTTRTAIGKRHRSNGHARASYHERPISRMGVLVVDARDGLDRAALRRTLLEQIRRQGAPFGLRVIDAANGETATDAYNFQAFLGETNLAAKVYPDGREELIRGVDFVGTPLNAVRSIVAVGREHAVDNAFCGAESGYVPVSTVSPAMVVSELELQSKVDTPYSPYTFPIPWDRGRRR